MQKLGLENNKRKLYLEEMKFVNRQSGESGK
jgi:hypothetical protein